MVTARHYSDRIYYRVQCPGLQFFKLYHERGRFA
jgi:hypothetical protein